MGASRAEQNAACRLYILAAFLKIDIGLTSLPELEVDRKRHEVFAYLFNIGTLPSPTMYII
jgi:hypothetical protein